jgi:hypothetical protein
MDSATAKQFLISKVIEEAEFEHVTLSEIEKKMLYFAEVHPSLPDIYEVNAEFERNYDTDEYEAKVAGFLRNARDRDAKESPSGEQQWKNALDAVKKEDHYILVMVSQAFGAGSASGGANRVRDFLVYIAVGTGLVLLLILASIWRSGH